MNKKQKHIFHNSLPFFPTATIFLFFFGKDDTKINWIEISPAELKLKIIPWEIKPHNTSIPPMKIRNTCDNIYFPSVLQKKL